MDEASFSAFYAKTSRPLWSYIRRVSGDASLADDLLQESFCRFLSARLSDMNETQMRAYLYRIATRLMHDHWRRAKRDRRYLAEESWTGESQQRQDSQELRHALGKLNEQERMLIWLAYAEGFAHREIAEAVGLREKSLRVLLFRARQKLSRLLNRG
jgi:RNA polymerase sigma-70 factor (ECF subfamily)